MFKKDDYLVYGKDVCIVRDILKNYFNKEDYYLLVPIKDQSLKIKTPINDKYSKIRKIISKEELENLIHTIPSVDVIESNDKFMEHEYKNLLATGNHLDLVKIIKTTYLRNKKRIDDNKKISEKDNNYFNLAKEYLYNEVAVVLGISYEEAKKYMIEKVSSL